MLPDESCFLRFQISRGCGFVRDCKTGVFPVSTGTNFHPPESQRLVIVDFPGQFIQRIITGTARGVAGNPVVAGAGLGKPILPGIAQQFVHRHVERFPLQIPQSRFDTR
jgi:hypothetical protein